jgi:3'(2'), 5'-bisphosphate nucleotidase
MSKSIFIFIFYILVGDFAAQAVISSILHHAFPDDPIVGEEDASDLRAESGKEMKDRIVELANEALTSELELGDNGSWGIGLGEQKSDAQLLDAIDRGNYEGGRNGRKIVLVRCYTKKTHGYLY